MRTAQRRFKGRDPSFKSPTQQRRSTVQPVSRFVDPRYCPDSNVTPNCATEKSSRGNGILFLSRGAALFLPTDTQRTRSRKPNVCLWKCNMAVCAPLIAHFSSEFCPPGIFPGRSPNPVCAAFLWPFNRTFLNRSLFFALNFDPEIIFQLHMH